MRESSTNSSATGVASEIAEAWPLLVDRISRACEVGQEDGLALLREVLRFLELAADSRESLTPSPLVDLAWHELILFTRLYAELCERMFGAMVHHSPGGSSSENHARYGATVHHYRARFGEPPPAYWPRAFDPAECGSCESPPIQSSSI